MKSENPKYRIEEGIRTDLDGDAYTIYNVYYEGKYLFSADTEWYVEVGISKREAELSQRARDKASCYFLHAHEGSNYLRAPFTNPRSGMGILK